MSERVDPVVEAINDLTRVIIAINGNFASKSEAIRRLHDLSIPNNRIAAILAVPVGDVTSLLAKDRKKQDKANKETSNG